MILQAITGCFHGTVFSLDMVVYTGSVSYSMSTIPQESNLSVMQVLEILSCRLSSNPRVIVVVIFRYFVVRGNLPTIFYRYCSQLLHRKMKNPYACYLVLEALRRSDLASSLLPSMVWQHLAVV